MTEPETFPVLRLDDRGPGPGALIAGARSRRFSRDSPFYPGLRAPAPAGYAEALCEEAAPEVAAMMGWPRVTGLVPLASHYSLVTDPPSALSPLQRVPHTDGPDGDVVALLHYLCGPGHGGTAFFRHRATGFARITADRRAAYDASLDRDVASHGPPPPCYLGQEDEWWPRLYDRFASHDCRPGRLLAYPANGLHCGRIPPGYEGSADPARGRLTLNTFARRAA